MEQGWDPNVKKFFIKILNTVSLGLSWMIASAVAGIYFKLGYNHGQPFIYIIIFYSLMLITLFLLIKYLYKIWKDG